MKHILIFIFSIHLSISAFAEVTLKWGIDKELYYQVRIAKELSAKIKALTHDEVKIDIITYDEKKEAISVTSLIESGRFDITQGVVSDFHAYAPELKIWELPFLFESFEHLEKYFQSAHAKKVLEKISVTPAFKAIGYSFSGGPLLVFSQKKSQTFSDFSNQEFSMSLNDGFYDDFLKPDAIKGVHEGDIKNKPNGELLAAGAEGIYSREDTDKLWVNITNHRMVARFTVVNKNAFNKISEKNQKILMTEFDKFLTEERRLSKEGADLALAILKNRGANINTWSRSDKVKELTRWKSTISKSYSEFKSSAEVIDSLNPNGKFYLQFFTE
jgi:TRAP-type transport system periplasmic protein